MSTYSPIASQTLSAAAASVTFSGIPQTYTDLILVVTGYLANNDAYTARFTFNGDSGSNYSQTNMTGTGSTAKSSRFSSATSIIMGSNDLGWSTTAANRNVSIVQIMNYSNTTTYKTTIARSNQPAGSYPAAESEVGLWRSTAAITSMVITGGGADFAAGSTFNLYGIDAQASAQAKATGGTSIYTDGTYWYHIFNQSGTFTPSVAISNVDYLVIAGGGGAYVQGGGAGGYRTSAGTSGANSSAESKINVSASAAYTITVGAGGTAGGTGGQASPSSISGTGITTITSTGGGGVLNGNNGANGGSGGGAFNSGTAGTGTANQGLAGGASSTDQAGGGGGGASAVGTATAGSVGGNGGNGLASSISGSSITRAGGGAGYGTGGNGTPGTGGGGTANDATLKHGVANTGGGGAGANAGNGGAGGSGIVIVRYAV